MAEVACPGCGAPIAFKSAASVMAVCEYCHTTVLKEAGAVRDLGKMAVVLEDYSPIQIGTSGVFHGQSFSVVGRIQLRYSDGFWNEWYILFDGQSPGWLSDASGQYVITIERSGYSGLPAFGDLHPGRRLNLGKEAFTASDVRTAQCTGGQGELPFQVGPGWQAKVADFRSVDRFMTLDYSDSEQPVVYLGEAVTLAGLSAQMLRDPDTVTDGAGRYRGRLEQLACPSCGAALTFAPGMTTHAVCPSCHAGIDLAGPKAEVIEAARRMDAHPFTIPLGSKGTIDGESYIVMGAMQRTEDDQSSSWTEYLLYSARRGFLWLVQTDSGWERADVLDVWPQWSEDGHLMLGQDRFEKLYDYGAQVVFVAGSFNWRVKAGERTRIVEFSHGTVKLAAEASREELTWSRSRPVSADELRAFFGGQATIPAAPKVVDPEISYTTIARWIIIALAIIDGIPIILGSGTFGAFVLVALLIYLPAWFLDRSGSDKT